MKRTTAMLPVLFLAGSFACGQVLEPFDADPAANPAWELQDNLGASHRIEGGWWEVTCPAGLEFNHWVGLNDAVQLRRDDFAENFVVETRLSFLQPPDFYHVGLMVYFDVFDILAWGPFCSEWVEGGCARHVAAEQTGAAQIHIESTGTDTLDLQIRKEGTNYRFKWRTEDTDPWTESGSHAIAAPPQYVGLFIKNWGPPPGDSIVQFDYFDIQSTGGEAPTFEPVPSLQRLPVGFPYARMLRTTGFPQPTLTLVAGPPGLTVEGNRVRGWTPTAGDAEQRFSCTVRAQNDAGSADLIWDILVTAAPFSDTFDDIALGEAWTWHVPHPGPTWNLEEAPGHLRLELPNDSFDHWGNANRTSFDRMPRVLADLPTDGDFAVETRFETRVLGLQDHLHTGLWIGFDAPVVDGILYGVAGNSGINAAIPYPLLRGERTAHWDYDFTQELVTPVVDTQPLSIRLEKRGDLYRFLYRYDETDSWTLLQELSLPPLVVKNAGLFVKNWNAAANLYTDFDSFAVMAVNDNEPAFQRGDANLDGALNIADAIQVLGYLFGGAGELGCQDTADANDDGALNIADAIAILGHLFGGAADLPAPFGACGSDPTDDQFPACTYPVGQCH